MMRLALLALATLLVAPPLLAQSKLEPPELERYLRWGPLRVRPGFRVTNLGYDDNILLGTADRRISDYTATLSPRLDALVLLGDRGFITLREQLDYTAYVDNSDQNFTNTRSSARLTVPLRRLGFFADVGVDRVRERPADLDDIRPKRREDRLGFGVILQPGWRTEIEIGRTFEDLSYRDPDFGGVGSSIGDVLDRAERGTNVGLRYRARGRTAILLDARVETIDFDHPRDGIARDTRERRLLGGAEFGEGGSLTGSVRLGWSRIDAESPSLPDLSEAIGDAELAYRLNSRTRFELEGWRRPGFSIFEANSYYLESRATLRGIYYLNRLIGVEAASTVGRVTFPDAADAMRRDRLRRNELGLRLRLMENSIGRRVEYSLTLGRYRRDSTLDSLDRSQTSVGLGAVLGF